MSRASELTKNTLLLGLSKIATQVVSFSLIPIYTFFLAPNDLGLIDLIATYIALIVPFLTIQLEFATFRFAIEKRNNQEKLSELISTILAIILPVIIISMVIFFAISLFITTPYAPLIVLNIFTSIIASVFLQFSRGIGRTKTFAIANIVAGITTALLSIAFIAILRWSASSILLATALSNVIVVIYLFFAMNLRKQIKPKRINFKIGRELLTYSLPLLPNNISWWVLNISDRTIISLVIGAAANGIYAIASKLAFIPGVIFGIFNMSWTETASLHIDKPDRDEYFSKICNNAIKIYSCITALFIATLPILFPYLVGREYLESYKYIPILALGSLAQGLVGLYSAIYIAKKKTKQIANTSLLAAIINIVVNLSLIYFIGVYAAAISTLVAFLALFIYRHFDVQQYARITYDNNVFIKVVVLLVFTITICYWNNNIANIISLIFVVASTVLLNRTFIAELFNIIKNKLSNTLRL